MSLIARLDQTIRAFKKMRAKRIAKAAMKEAIQGMTQCFHGTFEGFSFSAGKSFEACFEEAKDYFTSGATFCFQQYQMIVLAEQEYQAHLSAFTHAAENLTTHEIKQIEQSFSGGNPRVQAVFSSYFSSRQLKVLKDSLPTSKKSRKITV